MNPEIERVYVGDKITLSSDGNWNNTQGFYCDVEYEVVEVYKIERAIGIRSPVSQCLFNVYFEDFELSYIGKKEEEEYIDFNNEDITFI